MEIVGEGDQALCECSGLQLRDGTQHNKTSERCRGVACLGSPLKICCSRWSIAEYHLRQDDHVQILFRQGTIYELQLQWEGRTGKGGERSDILRLPVSFVGGGDPFHFFFQNYSSTEVRE